MSGAYRARICAFNELVCDNPEQCEEPPPTGVFMNGSVAGNSTCYAAKFDIFYEDEYLLIIISEDTIVVV